MEYEKWGEIVLAISDVKMKEVIDISTGERLGYVYDFVVDLEKGVIISMIAPGNAKGFGFFTKSNDIIINWEDIIKIGTDTILINSKHKL